MGDISDGTPLDFWSRAVSSCAHALQNPVVAAAAGEDFVRKPGATYVYFDIHKFGTCPNCEGGRMIFELFTDIVPKTAENFRCLSAFTAP